MLKKQYFSGLTFIRIDKSGILENKACIKIEAIEELNVQTGLTKLISQTIQNQLYLRKLTLSWWHLRGLMVYHLVITPVMSEIKTTFYKVHASEAFYLKLPDEHLNYFRDGPWTNKQLKQTDNQNSKTKYLVVYSNFLFLFLFFVCKN